MRALVIAAVLLVPGAALAEAPARWLVLPIHCTQPPPADPTLLRTTRMIGEVIQGLVGEDVRVASREVRDERCPSSDGVCSPDVARALGVERVVALHLAPGYETMHVRVFRGDAMEREGRIACRWDAGGVACETEALVPLLAVEEAPPADPAAVRAAYEALRPRISRCGKSGETPAAGSSVSFRARPDGRVLDVRIDPAELQGGELYACIARAVEGLRVPAFSGTKPELFRFELAEPEPKKPAKKRPARKPVP